ncbi:MAG: acyl-CoA dehydrogenase family protein [Anaerolineae bacterium]|nr:acyl-CoA dehydrogenase family protein [Phycisphaerae bacterium]
MASQPASSDFYDLDSLLSPGDIAVRDSVRKFVDEQFLPTVNKHWHAGTFPMELLPEMGRINCFGATIKGYGCAGLSNLAYGLVMRELERGDSGLRTVASVQGALAMNAIYYFGSEQQKQRWLPEMAKGLKIGCFGLTESEFGSNPAGMQTTARKAANGWTLTGEKMWIGNGNLADVAVVWAKTDGGAESIRGFLVEKNTTGFRAELIEGKMSLRAAYTARLTFDNCALPDDAILPNSKGLKSALQCLNHARYGIAWGAVGAGMACFDEARDYAMKRQQFGKPIASFQLIQRKLAIMLTELTKAQLVALRLAQLKDANIATPAQISLAKRDNVATAIEIARTTRDLLGGVGILDRYASFRHMNNLESVKTYEGTEDMHLLIMGQAITRIPAYS